MASGEFWILALSGGGARGRFTAKVLANLEKAVGGPLANRFDLIAGTSVGGILALGLAKEIPAKKLVALFDHADEIFTPRRCLFNWSLFGPKYSNEKLKALLAKKETFGKATIGNLKHRVMIPSVNYTKGTPTFFKTPHHPRLRIDWEYSLVDVAMATAAAPTFFPVYGFGNQHFVDGGLVANAPGLVAVHEAMHFAGHPDVKTIHVVPFMNIELTNVSDLPALDIHVSILDNKTGATLKSLKPYRLSESYTLRIMKGTPINISAKAKSEWPVASTDDVKSIVRSDCITGAGLGFQRHLTSDIDIMDRPQGAFLSRESSLLLKVSYKTIFGQQMSFVVSGVIDTANRKSDYMIPRGSKKASPLVCIGDPGWDSTMLFVDR
jgi:hypothetical protein